MDWEKTKENCVPVRQGRSKAALQEIADPAQEALDAKRRELWADITGYKGDDPLEPWQRYIKWMQEYGVGGGKADLMKVLEACTKELQKYPRYTNDVRFLRIWIQYADCLPDPDDVFLFLKEKGIGREFALYYEAYATYFELKGNFQAADAVYMDGIQRGVRQLERLKQKHAAFQQRMAQRVQRRIQDEQVLGPPPPEPVRANLAAIGPRGSGRAPSGQQQQQQIAAGIFGVAAAPQQQGLFGQRPTPAQPERGLRPTVGLREDDEFTCGETPRLGQPGYSLIPQANSLRELQPYGVRRKENLDRALAWNQAPLLPGATAVAVGPPPAATATSGLDIFTDEEFQEGGFDLPERARCAGSLQHRSGAPTAQSPLLGTNRVTGAVSGGGDALMLRLAPPRVLLPGVPPGPMHSVAESIAAAPISAPAAPAQSMVSSQQTKMLSGTLGAAAGPRQPFGAAVGRDGLAIRPDAVSTGAEAAAPALFRAPAEAAACEQAGRDGEEETSFEELRAKAWFQRNPLLPHQVSTSAENARPAGLESCGVSCRGGGRPTAPGSGAAAMSSQPQSPPASRAPEVLSGNAAGVDDAATRTSAGTACATDPEAVASTSAASRSAPFGLITQAPVASAAGVPGLPTQILQDGSCRGAQENGSAAPREKMQRRTLMDAAPVALGPVAPPTCGALSSSLSSTRPVELRPDPLPLQSQPVPAAALPHAAGGSARVCDRRHDDAQPTVTISTRGAFDLINSLFSEDLPHQHARADCEQPRPLTIAAESQPPPAAMRPPAITVEVRAPWPQPQTAPKPGALLAPRQPTAAEPTVTLHTRLAFDALNDMFCDTLPHEEARKLARRGASVDGSTTQFKMMTTSDVCRLANAARSSTHAAAGPCTSRRDLPGGGMDGTGSGIGGVPISGGLEANATAAHGVGVGPSLAMHEDTFFLDPAPAALPSDAMPRGGVAGRAGPPLSHGPHQALREMNVMYEDTEFVPRGGGQPSSRSGSAASTGAFILEDTEFVTRHPPVAQVAPLASSVYDRDDRAHAGTASSFAPAGTMADRNATQGMRARTFAGGNSAVSAFSQLRYSSKSALQVYEDTQYDLGK